MENLKSVSCFKNVIFIALLGLLSFSLMLSGCGNSIDFSTMKQGVKSFVTDYNTALSIPTNVSQTSDTISSIGLPYTLYADSMTEDEKTALSSITDSFIKALVEPLENMVNSESVEFKENQVYVDNTKLNWECKASIGIDYKNVAVNMYDFALKSDNSYSQYKKITLELDKKGLGWVKAKFYVVENVKCSDTIIHMLNY